MAKKLTKVVPKTSPNQHHLEAAYDLVIADLFRSLKKMKDGDKILLGELGTFQKKERILRSAIHGKTYAYYHIGFKASRSLKKELDK